MHYCPQVLGCFAKYLTHNLTRDMKNSPVLCCDTAMDRNQFVATNQPGAKHVWVFCNWYCFALSWFDLICSILEFYKLYVPMFG